MKSELKKNIFHLAWSPDSLPAHEAAAPLLDCLDHILLDLEPNLLKEAFQRCVAAIWDVLLVELWAQAEVSSGVSIHISFFPSYFSFPFLFTYIFLVLLNITTTTTIIIIYSFMSGCRHKLSLFYRTNFASSTTGFTALSRCS